jgi:predicted O-methyltransferase YrrM
MMQLSELATADLREVVRRAWDVGQQIDLSGIGYGRIHWGNKEDVDDTPHPYYHFLAGLVRHNRLTRILEIGTHWGGATRAMWKGLRDPSEGTVVTVDISTESDNRLKGYPDIKKIVGDANKEETMAAVAEAFDGPADLVYIDALHFAMPTYLNYALYASLLRPKLVVFDDITLNSEMERMWSWVQRSLPDRDTINATSVEPRIRAKPGFGVALLRSNL